MTAPRDDVVIHRSRHRGEGRRLELVLQAMSIEHAIRLVGDEWTLSVLPDQVEEAVRQIDAYERENHDWPRRRVAVPHHRVGVRGAAGYAGVLLLVAFAESHDLFDLDWFGAGRVHTAQVRHGEWWRTLTALTLHVDIAHLVANMVIGSMFGLIVGQLLGNGLAWFSILVAGAVGNAISALIQPPGHAAVGASTAVFAALGLLAAYVWRRRRDLNAGWVVRWAPIIGAVALFAFLGSGGERTDVVAHLSGFLTGIVVGARYGIIGPGIVPGPRSQWVLGLGALALLTLTWAMALAAHGTRWP